MANEILSPTSNSGQGAIVGGVSSVDESSQIVLRMDPSTKRALVSATIAGDLPLPTGAATSAKQDTLLAELQLKADLTETQPVDITAIATIYHGSKTVPTGTAEAIASSQTIKSVTIKALSTNTVAVYIGATGVTTSGFELLAGESVSLDVNNLSLVFVISGSAAQIVRYIAI